jgi:hypothetical protein
MAIIIVHQHNHKANVKFRAKDGLKSQDPLIIVRTKSGAKVEGLKEEDLNCSNKIVHKDQGPWLIDQVVGVVVVYI